MIRRGIWLILAVLLIISTVNCLSASAFPQNLQVYSNDTFTITVDFSFKNAGSASIITNFDNNSLRLSGPAEIVNLGQGTFTGSINYSFRAIGDNPSAITFELRDGVQTESVQTSVSVIPRHVYMTLDKEIVYVNAGEDFTLNVNVESQNSENVQVKLDYDSAKLTTAEQKNIYLGGGSFVQTKTILFTANDLERVGNQTIEISACSDKECVDKEVLVVVKSFSLFASTEENKIKPGETFGVTYTVKNFNNGPGILSFDFDKNWFEVLGSSSKTIRQDDYVTDTVYFKMKDKVEFCPGTDFRLTFAAGGQSITKDVSISLAPAVFAENPEEKLVTFGESFTSELSLFYFGFENGKVEIDYPQKNVALEKKDIAFSGCEKKDLTFEFTAKNEEQEYSTGSIAFVFKEGEEAVKTINQKIILVKTDPELLMLCNPNTIMSSSGGNSIQNKCNPVVEPPKKCPPGFEYNPVTKKCEKHPPVEIICDIGVYNETTGTCQYSPNVSVLCPIGEYNETLDLCIYYPEQEIICQKGTYDPSSDLCIYYPDLGIVCPPLYTYNINSNICEYFPGTEIVCTFGTYNATTNTCQYYPINEIICSQGTYNPATEKCEIFPEIQPICDIGTYNSSTGTCQYHPAVQAVCDTGTYNNTTNTCQYYPENETVCTIGTYNPSTNKCEWFPEPIIICPAGFEYDAERQACVDYPDTSYICVSGGNYDPESGKCIIDITEYVCGNPNATYSNGTCTLIVNSTVQCSVAGAVYNNGSCTYSVSSSAVCSVGVFDAATGTCVYIPPSSALCEKGTYNITLEACVYKPETNIQCEKGTYNSATDKCDYSPEPAIKTSELSVELNEVFALTADVYNDFGETIQVKDSDLIVSDNSAIRIISSSLGVSNLAPGESGRLSYLVKFEKPGNYNATLKIKYGDTEIDKPYIIKVKAPEGSISGMFYTETPYLPISMVLVLATVIGAIATIITAKIKLKKEFD